jgi:hypothetical protein
VRSSFELELQDSVSLFLSRGQAEFTKLVPDLSGVDPDDSFSSIPYEKGFCLLQYIQTIVRKVASLFTVDATCCCYLSALCRSA